MSNTLLYISINSSNNGSNSNSRCKMYICCSLLFLLFLLFLFWLILLQLLPIFILDNQTLTVKRKGTSQQRTQQQSPYGASAQSDSSNSYFNSNSAQQSLDYNASMSSQATTVNVAALGGNSSKIKSLASSRYVWLCTYFCFSDDSFSFSIFLRLLSTSTFLLITDWLYCFSYYYYYYYW